MRGKWQLRVSIRSGNMRQVERHILRLIDTCSRSGKQVYSKYLRQCSVSGQKMLEEFGGIRTFPEPSLVNLTYTDANGRVI